MAMQRKATYATACQIREYRKLTGKSASKIQSDLGLHYISVSAINGIVSGRTYKIRKQKEKGHRLTPDDVKKIKGALRLGKRLEWVALEFGVSFCTIQRIKTGKAWREVA